MALLNLKNLFIAIVLFLGTSFFAIPQANAQQTGIVAVTCSNGTFNTGWDNSNSYFADKGNIAAHYCDIIQHTTYVSDNLENTTLRWYNGILPTPIAKPEPVPSPEPTPTQSPKPEPSPTPTPTVEPTPEPSATPTPTPTVEPSSTSKPENKIIPSPIPSVGTSTSESTQPTPPTNPEPSPTPTPIPVVEPQPTPTPIAPPIAPEPPPALTPEQIAAQQAAQQAALDAEKAAREAEAAARAAEEAAKAAEQAAIEAEIKATLDAATKTDGVEPVLIVSEPELPPAPPPVPVEPAPEPPTPVEPAPEPKPVIPDPVIPAPIPVPPVEPTHVESNPAPSEQPSSVEEPMVTLENGVVISEEVAVALAILGNPAELLQEIFTNPQQVVTALLNVGADMTPEVRKEAKRVVLSAIIAGNIATQSAVAAAGIATYRRKP